MAVSKETGDVAKIQFIIEYFVWSVLLFMIISKFSNQVVRIFLLERIIVNDWYFEIFQLSSKNLEYIIVYGYFEIFQLSSKNISFGAYCL